MSLTKAYSTSFSLGIRALEEKHRGAIYGIYGFVRLADEIVDTFYGHDQKALLANFREDVHLAIQNRLSLNPVLHSFQYVVNHYKIDAHLIDSFLESMELDLTYRTYDRKSFDKYVYGSAEVVGLMCLKVFTEGDKLEYERLVAPACRLGAAFQKVNFLRDMKSDFEDRGRVYFPKVEYRTFNAAQKKEIEQEIDEDFKAAYLGIKELPKSARLGVFSAYMYYLALHKKIKGVSVGHIKEKRLRIPNMRKAALLFTSTIKHRLNLL